MCGSSQILPVLPAGIVGDADRSGLPQCDWHHESHRGNLVGNRTGCQPGGTKQADDQANGDEHPAFGNDCQSDGKAQCRDPAGDLPVHDPESLKGFGRFIGLRGGDIDHQADADQQPGQAGCQRDSGQPHCRHRANAVNKGIIADDVEAKSQQGGDDLR